MIGVDEGTIQKAAAGGKVAEDLSLPEDPMAEANRHRRHRAGRDDPHQQQPAPRPARGEVQGGQKNRQRRTGLGDDRPGFRWIEAERP